MLKNVLTLLDHIIYLFGRRIVLLSIMLLLVVRVRAPKAVNSSQLLSALQVSEQQKSDSCSCEDGYNGKIPHCHSMSQ